MKKIVKRIGILAFSVHLFSGTVDAQDLVLTLGETDEDEGGLGLYINHNGYLLGTGYKGGNSTVFQTDLLGNFSWTRELDLLPGEEERINATLYTDNIDIGTGTGIDVLLAVGSSHPNSGNNNAFALGMEIPYAGGWNPSVVWHYKVEDMDYQDLLYSTEYDFQTNDVDELIITGERGSTWASMEVVDMRTGFHVDVPNNPGIPFSGFYQGPNFTGSVNNSDFRSMVVSGQQQLTAGSMNIQSSEEADNTYPHLSTVNLYNQWPYPGPTPPGDERYIRLAGSSAADPCQLFGDQITAAIDASGSSFSTTEIIYMFHGDEDGYDENDQSIYLVRMDKENRTLLSDQVKIDFPDYGSVRPRVIQANGDHIPGTNVTAPRDGYIVLGEVGPENRAQIFILKVDNSLQPEWCKVINHDASRRSYFANTNPRFVADDDVVYFTASTDGFSATAGDDNMLWCKVELEETQNDCFTVIEVESENRGFELANFDWLGHSYWLLPTMYPPGNTPFTLTRHEECSDCESWVSTFGNEDDDSEGGTTIVENNRGLYVAGYNSNGATLSFVLKDGSHVWTRELDINGIPLTIRDMIEEDGDLIAVGFIDAGANRRGVAFKYDPVGNTFDWISMESNDISVYTTINDDPNSEDHIMTGSVRINATSSASDIMIATLDPTGFINQELVQSADPLEDGVSFFNVEDAPNNFYYGGRLSQGNIRRPYVARQTVLGTSPAANQSYRLNPAFANNRRNWWSKGPIFHNGNTAGNLFTAIYKDDFTQPAIGNLGIVEINPNVVPWTVAASNAITFGNYDTYRVHQIESVDNGFIIFGDAMQASTGSNDVFIMFIEETYDVNQSWVLVENRNLNEIKRLGNRGMAIDANSIFITGEAMDGTSTDVLVASINLDGTDPSGCFEDVQLFMQALPTTLTALNWTNPNYSIVGMQTMAGIANVPTELDNRCECPFPQQFEARYADPSRGGDENEEENREGDVIRFGSIDRPMSIFPNPSSGIFNITGLQEENTTIRVFSTKGDMVVEKHIGNGAARNHELDLSQFPNGLYILQIVSTDGAVFTEKIHKE